MCFCVCLHQIFEMSRTSARARICLDLTDFVPPEDWGPEYPIPGTVRHNVPIPTIYNVDGKLILCVRLKDSASRESLCNF